MTVIPAATAAAIAAARAKSDGVKLPGVRLSLPQLQVMMSGESATAALKEPIEFEKFIFTGSSWTSGATANMFADSPVPCPLSSFVGLAAAGPNNTGATR